MAKLIAIHQIHSGGKVYTSGQEFEEKDATEAKRLVELGAAKEVETKKPEKKSEEK